MHAVFVFGTLKEGFPNADSNRGSRLSGAFLTSNRYPLYLVGERHSPWLIDSAGEGFQVRGEVYQVDDAGLEQMDRLERVSAADGYRRARVTVVSEVTNTPMEVYVYWKSAEQLDGMQLMLGPMAEYELQHASLYRKRPR